MDIMVELVRGDRSFHYSIIDCQGFTRDLGNEIKELKGMKHLGVEKLPQHSVNVAYRLSYDKVTGLCHAYGEPITQEKYTKDAGTGRWFTTPSMQTIFSYPKDNKKLEEGRFSVFFRP